ncbi:peptidoglycan DD-metalloendopeptidase family protein [Uruburuella testudinis]|uniref:Peptidoglycan DD-metalloendopeptidase family protein n=1 Tax=Uruburuella testudinis TaxID=1282863 RepID=A0ABY4DUH9_9NEIS|nr:peptidoglycan DD-metalloendopeptidase family protein [Uruburuella testudinis]UOO82267.1 peptidoglycan DD-metalloendopeptidase family protein [Uruburuella testudinis]
MNTPNLVILKKILLGAVVAFLAACAGSPANGPVPEGHYRVQPGDNLYRIGLRFGQSVNTLARWNNLRDASQIEVGQVLRVRSGGAAATSSRATRTASHTPGRSVAPVNRLKLQWPVADGARNIIAHYNGTTNKGIDIGGNRGAAVQAAADGKVLYAGEGVRGYGKLILISHNSSTLTAYAHNDSINVQKNQNVRAGQTIAAMGSSDTDRVKLHFEVRINGKAVNPMPYLNR